MNIPINIINELNAFIFLFFFKDFLFSLFFCDPKIEKIIQNMDRDQTSDIAKEISDVAKEASNTTKYDSVLDHKFGGVPLRALIHRSR